MNIWGIVISKRALMNRVITDDSETDIKADTTITGVASASELFSVNELETVCRISMNSVDNALGMRYILARDHTCNQATLETSFNNNVQYFNYIAPATL